MRPFRRDFRGLAAAAILTPSAKSAAVALKCANALDRMQKWTAVLLFVLVVGFGATLFVAPRPKATSDAADGGVDGAAAMLAGDDDAGAAPDGAAVEPVAQLSDAGSTLLDGQLAPGLPGSAPRKVTFGAILVQYRGAQLAPPTARAKDAALDLAKEIAADAKQDFKAAIAKAAEKGVKDASENYGQIEKGFLEPAPDFVLFSLPKGGVSDPVDSPRGYLIFKRIE